MISMSMSMELWTLLEVEGRANKRRQNSFLSALNKQSELHEKDCFSISESDLQWSSNLFILINNSDVCLSLPVIYPVFSGISGLELSMSKEHHESWKLLKMYPL